MGSVGSEAPGKEGRCRLWSCLNMQWIFLVLLGLCWPGSSASQDSDAHQKLWVAPYNFSLDSFSHQLHTSWEVKGASVSFLCAFADFALVEIGFTGKEQELSSGNSWAVQCEEQEVGDKMIVDVDITKYRVQPFKSYKVCISLEDPTSGSFLRRVCTHLFSFERAVPYVPTVRKVTKAVSAKLSVERESEKNTLSEDVKGVKEKSGKETKEKEEERRGLVLQRVSRTPATLCATTSAKSNAHWRSLSTTAGLIFRVHLGFSSLLEFFKLCFRINQTVQLKK